MCKGVKELDALGATYPIDFYTEYSKGQQEGTNNNILFRRFLHNIVKACHDRSLRSHKAYEKECPTKHIRWQYSNPWLFHSSRQDGRGDSPLT